MSAMQPIQPLWAYGTMPLTQMTEVAEEEAQKVVPFSDIFQAAIRDVQETDGELVNLEYMMASGELDNPAQLLIAATKAGYAVDMLVQLRNRAVDAYNEIMRISL